MARSIEYQYSKNGQLIKTTEDEQLSHIDWPEEKLIKEGDMYKIDRVNPGISIADQSLEIEEENGHIKKLTNQNQTGLTLEKDHQEQLTQIELNKKNKIESTISFEYDDAGNLIRKTNHGLNKSESYTYENGLKKSFTDMEGRTFFWNYDEKGKLISESVNTEKEIIVYHEYDTNGLKKSSRLEGIVNNYLYDQFGNLIEEKIGSENKHVIYRKERDSLGNIIKATEGNDLREKDFLYDVNNRLIAIKEARGETSISYDEENQLQKLKDPQGRVTTIYVKDEEQFLGIKDPQGKEWRAAYDEKKRILWKKRPDGNTINYTYDPSGLHIREITAEGVNQRRLCENKNIKYAKNKFSNCIFQYNKAAQHIGYNITIGGSDPIEIRYDLDATGIRKSLSTVSKRITKHIYDENEKVLHFEKEDLRFGKNIDYEHDERGRLISIKSGTFLMKFNYGSNGGMNQIIRGNAVNSDINYTDFGYLDDINTLHKNKALSRLQFVYDKGGNLVSKTVDNQEHWEYKYDKDDQLIELNRNNEKQKYHYDSVANCTQIEAKQMRKFQYDADYVYLENCDRWQYHYDLNGFLIEKVSLENTKVKHRFSYSSLGQLLEFRKTDETGKEILVANYCYDALGRRIEKKVEYTDLPEKNSHRYFVYDGDNLLLEYDKDFSSWRKYIYLDTVDSLIGFIENDRSYYYLRDNQGSVTHVLDESGNAIIVYSYDPFGNLISEFTNDNATENRFRFASREWDEESETYFFRNRTYDPNTGRFLQADPYPGDYNKPITMINKYVFAANNPMKYTDPYGLFIVTALIILGSIIAAPIAILLAVVTMTLITIAASIIIAAPFLMIGFVGGLIGGIDSYSRGGSFQQGFKGAFTDTVQTVSSIAGVTNGVLFGALGYIYGGIIGLFDGGNWKKGAERGWDIGYNTGFFIGAWPGELALNIMDVILDDEIDYRYYYELACFSAYCSQIAYIASNSDRIQRKLPKGVETKAEFIIDHSGADTQGFIAEHKDFILLSFRGTELDQWDDISTDLNAMFREDWYGIDFPYLEQIGLGWFQAYDPVRNQIHNAINTLLKQKHRPVFTTGHSLGGALAVVASLDISEQFNCEVYCNTFGSPRVGNQAFVSLFNAKVHNCHLIQHRLDPVPEVPFNYFGFYHVDKERVIASKAFDTHSMDTYVSNIYYDSSEPLSGFRFLPSFEAIDIVTNPDTDVNDYPDIHDKMPLSPLKFL